MLAAISLEELFKVLLRRIRLIVSCSLVGLILTGAYTFFVVTPMYDSSTRIVVNQTQSANQALTNTDIQTNLNLIDTYQSILKDPVILNEVVATTQDGLTVNDLRDKISIETEDNSLVFELKVTDDNPHYAAYLANVVATTFAAKIGDILEVQSVNILSPAEARLNPISPDINMNLSLGFMVGLLLGGSLAYLAEYMDKRVKSPAIIQDLELVNLGSVYEMTTKERTDSVIGMDEEAAPVETTEAASFALAEKRVQG